MIHYGSVLSPSYCISSYYYHNIHRLTLLTLTLASTILLSSCWVSQYVFRLSPNSRRFPCRADTPLHLVLPLHEACRRNLWPLENLIITVINEGEFQSSPFPEAVCTAANRTDGYTHGRCLVRTHLLQMASAGTQLEQWRARTRRPMSQPGGRLARSPCLRPPFPKFNKSCPDERIRLVRP